MDLRNGSCVAFVLCLCFFVAALGLLFARCEYHKAGCQAAAYHFSETLRHEARTFDILLSAANNPLLHPNHALTHAAKHVALAKQHRLYATAAFERCK